MQNNFPLTICSNSCSYQARSVILEIGGHFRAKGANTGGGARSPQENFLGTRPFSPKSALPCIIAVFVSVFIFQIETFGMKELSTINAKKVINNGGLKVVLGVAGTIYSDGNDPLELNT